MPEDINNYFALIGDKIIHFWYWALLVLDFIVYFVLFSKYESYYSYSILLKMKKILLLIIFCCGCLLNAHSQQSVLLKYIKDKSEIKEGGCNIFSYKDISYVICVSQVIVGSKSESSCKTVGTAKAKRDIIAFINGSEITSFTELKITETISEDVSGSKSYLKQEYLEVIKEHVVGHINQCVPLGGWYSQDKSVYYYAIYKTINL
jgi:hypothetical protein